MRAITMSRSDCDYAVSISWIGNADTAITLFRTSRSYEVEITVVTCASDDDRAGANQPVCFLTKRGAAARIVGDVMPD